MRIIAGEFRGRRLLAPEGDVTRPITDRVKQSLFDILAPTIPNARVYDCFAGTGSMGLECLSRGAAFVVFFEADHDALRRLRKNIAAVGAEARSQVVAGDLFRWFANPPANEKADLTFLDPPYRFLAERTEDVRSLATSIAHSHLATNGTVVFRHDASDELELPPFLRYDQRTYGGMALEFLRLPPK